MTNFERIKIMSVEEMAEFIHKVCCNEDCTLPTDICSERDCKVCAKKWLQSEVEKSE